MFASSDFKVDYHNLIPNFNLPMLTVDLLNMIYDPFDSLAKEENLYRVHKRYLN